MNATTTPTPIDLLNVIHDGRLLDIPLVEPPAPALGESFRTLRELLVAHGFGPRGDVASTRRYVAARQAVLRDRWYLRNPAARTLN